MGGAFGGGDKHFNLVGKNDQADLVIIFYGRKRQQGAQFSCHFIFYFQGASKRTGRGQVYQENDGQLPLFNKKFYMGFPGAGGYVPVNGPYVIADPVFPDLVKLHAASLEDTSVFTGKAVVNRLTGIDLDVAYFFGQFFWNHGTSTVSRICSIRSSDVFSSASAS